MRRVLSLAAVLLTLGACALTTSLDGFSGGVDTASDGGPETTSGDANATGTDGSTLVDAGHDANVDVDGDAASSCASECTGGTPFCDAARHICVECKGSTDCTNGKICSPSGACVAGCDPAAPNCDAGLTCCNGLCVDTKSDPLNCKTCGNGCGGGSCCGAACVNTSDGDPNNCGGCGKACATTNGTPSCGAGACTWACATNFAHCATGNTGCETPTNTTNNCGGCGKKCDTNRANNASCDGTTCSYQCKTGYSDCANEPPNTNGCETRTEQDTNNCGGCGRVCLSGSPVSQVSCNNNLCTSKCNGSTANCSLPKAPADDDGCETNLATACCSNLDCKSPPAPAACYTGACSASPGLCTYTVKANAVVCGNTCCNPVHATCGAGCALTCFPGFYDCNGDPSDGCESAGAAPGCCSGPTASAPGPGTTSMTSHSNGIGGNYFSCAPLGSPGSDTYTLAMAQAASDQDLSITGTITNTQHTTSNALILCKSNGSLCACWCYYDGPPFFSDVGRVLKGTTCNDPGPFEPTWR